MPVLNKVNLRRGFLSAAVVFLGVTSGSAKTIPDPAIAPSELAQAVSQQLDMPDIPHENVITFMDTIFGEMGVRLDFTGSESQRRAAASVILKRIPDAARNFRAELKSILNGDEAADAASLPDGYDIGHRCYDEKLSASFQRACAVFFTKSQEWDALLPIFAERAAELLELHVTEDDMQPRVLGLSTVAAMANDAVKAHYNRQPDIPID
jgi:hypothetical protein